MANKTNTLWLVVIGLITLDFYFIGLITQSIIENSDSDKSILNLLFFYPAIVLVNSFIANLFFVFGKWDQARFVFFVTIAMLVLFLPMLKYFSDL